MRTRTGALTVIGSAAAAGLILCAATMASAVTITVGTVEGEPGTAVSVPVSLDTEGASVAGVQNDIIFDPAIVNLAGASACTINPAIGDRLPECDEDPQAAPCKSLQRNLADCPAAAGCPEGSEGLRRFRGIILSTANVNEIPSGDLFTCEFQVQPDAAVGAVAELQNLNVGASDPTGTALDTTGVAGSVTVTGEVPACEELPLEEGEVRIDIVDTSVAPDAATVQVEVRLETNEQSVAGVQNDIVFDPTVLNLASATACAINPEIGDRLPECDEDPQTAPCKTLQRNLGDCPGAAGCPPESEGLRRFRAIVLSTANVNPIPDAVLYTCEFQVVGAAPIEAILQNLNVGASDPTGTALNTTGCGAIITTAVDEVTPTPTETVVGPTETPPVVTETPVLPTPTVTVPVPPTNTPVAPAVIEVEDDGCQLVAPAQSGTAWLLLIPAAALLWSRRRSR